MGRVPDTYDLADLGTKHVEHKKLDHLLPQLGCGAVAQGGVAGWRAGAVMEQCSAGGAAQSQSCMGR